MREIRVRKVKRRGVEKWQVLIPPDLNHGKRRYRFFNDEAGAKALVDQINADRGSIAELFHKLSPKSQQALMLCIHRVDGDVSQIVEALDQWQARRDLEAVLTVKRVQDECLASKRAANRRETYVKNLANSLRHFTTGRESLLVSQITTAMIDEWLAGGGWATATRQGLLKDVRTLFSFAVKRGYLKDNPAEKVDYPSDDEEGEPKILTVQEIRLLLSRAAKDDPPLARWIAIQVFGGLRKSEAKRLTDAEIRLDSIFVSAKTKTRTKRWVPINDTLKAWLALEGNLPLKNIVRRLRRVRGELKQVQSKRGVRMKHVIDIPFPRNCLRHSFCSYAVVVYPASKVAAWAGHREDVLYSTYRELVTESAAREFWSITP